MSLGWPCGTVYCLNFSSSTIDVHFADGLSPICLNWLLTNSFINCLLCTIVLIYCIWKWRTTKRRRHHHHWYILSTDRQRGITLLGAACSLCQPPACSHDTSAAVASLLQMQGTVLDRLIDRNTPPEHYHTLLYFIYSVPPLLGATLETLMREIDYRLCSDELANQVIMP